MNSDLRGSKRSAIAALFLALLVAMTSWTSVPLFQRTDLATFDAFQRASPRAYDPDTPVRIIAIDREALERFGQWPWPRPVLAELVTRLNDLGAAAIGFDILFSDPDRTSPEEIARSLSKAGGASQDTQRSSKSHDEIFAAAISNAPVILATIPRGDQGNDDPVVKANASWRGTDASEALHIFSSVDINLPALSDAASGVGSISVRPEDRQDGVIRKIPLAVRSGDAVVPAFTMEMLRVAQGARGYLAVGLPAEDEDALPRISSIRVGSIPIETTADGSLWVRFSGQQPQRTVSIARIFEENEAELRKQIEGRLVIVAATVPGLRDIVATPMSSNVPGAEVHAEILEQILSDASLTRPYTMTGVERLTAIGAGILVALGFLIAGFYTGSLMAIGAIVAVPVVSFFAFRDYGILFGPTIPVLAGLFAWTAGGLVDYFGARRERKEIRRQFEHFVAPDVIAEIAQDPDKHMTPGGEERDLTILFSDVRSFSTISAGLTPQELIDWLNSYLTPMAEAILEEKGTIDKFIGDAIMAFWNAPRRDPNHARQAMRGALAMARAMDDLNETFRGQGRPLAAFGIGLNTGPCSVGRIGARKRLDYTCIGDAVNVASRVEGLTKMYSATILVGEDSAQQAPDFALVEIDRVEVKGREGVPLNIHALLGDESVAKDGEFQATKADWLSALSLYRDQKFDQAEAAFLELSDGNLGGPARTFLGRIEALRADPPGEDWDAVFRADSK